MPVHRLAFLTCLKSYISDQGRRNNF